MENLYKEVEFNKYCKQCIHEGVPEYKEPCNECLESGMNLHSVKPVKFEKK